MNQSEQMPPAVEIGLAETLKAESPVDKSAEISPVEGQIAEQAEMAEEVKAQLKELSENSIFTSAADKFLEILDGTLMVPVKKAWDAVPKAGQDAFLASRYIPDPIISLYPHLVKLMTDVGFLDRKGGNSEEEIEQALQNEAKLDAFLVKLIGVIPEAKGYQPLIDKVVEGKKVFNQWIKERRAELKRRRAEKEDTEKMNDIREAIDSRK